MEFFELMLTPAGRLTQGAMGDIMFSDAIMLVGDCNGDGSQDAADLARVADVAQRDSVLAALNSLPGDFDGDGNVVFADFLILSENFGKDPATYAEGNADLEGGIAFADFLVLSENFGKTPDGAAVPEPTSRLMCAVLFALLPVIRRSRK